MDDHEAAGRGRRLKLAAAWEKTGNINGDAGCNGQVAGGVHYLTLRAVVGDGAETGQGREW